MKVFFPIFSTID